MIHVMGPKEDAICVQDNQGSISYRFLKFVDWKDF